MSEMTGDIECLCGRDIKYNLTYYTTSFDIYNCYICKCISNVIINSNGIHEINYQIQNDDDEINSDGRLECFDFDGSGMSDDEIKSRIIFNSNNGFVKDNIIKHLMNIGAIKDEFKLQLINKFGE